MYTTILLGAGASQAAGFPSTRDLTEQVLNGSGVTKNSGAIGYEVSSNDARLSTSPEIQPVVEIVHRLYELAKQYFLEFEKVGGIEQISYENLFYLAKQAHDEFAGEMENPAIFSFANELNTHYASNPRPWCRETLRYITSIVWKRLARHEPDLESVRHLKVISDVSNAGNINCIATLCHDTHIDAYLRREGVHLNDGFKNPTNCFRYWNGWNADYNSVGNPTFLKLHGSINWFSYGSGFSEYIAVPCRGYERMLLPNGEVQYAHPDGPLLLVGTFNKISDYSSRVFLEIHWQFRQAIREANRLVVCGYGFRDKRINEEIIDWMYQDRNNRLVVIHPNPQNLVESARNSIRSNVIDWEQTDSVEFIVKTFEEIKTDDFL